MIFFMQSLLVFYCMLFGNIGNFYEYSTREYMTESYDSDESEEAFMELETCRQAESKKEWAKWIANKENQSRFLEKIKCQVIEGGLDSSEEVSLMIVKLEEALISWNKSVVSKNVNLLKSPAKHSFRYIFCSENLSCSEDDDIDKSIQDLREQENFHKEEAFNLVMRAGEEAMSAGAFAVSGMGIPAIIMGGKASYDFVEGCKEYNKAIECEEKADALENENIDEEKRWWQFWK